MCANNVRYQQFLKWPSHKVMSISREPASQFGWLSSWGRFISWVQLQSTLGWWKLMGRWKLPTLSHTLTRIEDEYMMFMTWRYSERASKTASLEKLTIKVNQFYDCEIVELKVKQLLKSWVFSFFCNFLENFLGFDLVSKFE